MSNTDAIVIFYVLELGNHIINEYLVSLRLKIIHKLVVFVIVMSRWGTD